MSSNIEKVIVEVEVKTDMLGNQKNKSTNDTTNKLNKNMDSYNKAALNCLQTKGIECAIKHMFTDQDTGKALSYSEMRERYG